jgi:Zn-dependent protease with chaperone function
MDVSSKAKARFGFLLAGLFLGFGLVVIQLARRPETVALLVSLPGPAALICDIQCVGVLPFLQVVGEAGKALLMIAISGAFLYALLRMARRISWTWALIARAESGAVPALRLPPFPFLDRVTVFEGRQPLAFAAGFMKPKIYVSRGLVESLGENELHAVIRHEARHQKSKDPLKGLLVSFVSDLLFFLPVSRLLKNAYHLTEEMAADVRSVRSPAEAADLASSLLRVRQLSGAGASMFFDPVLARARNLTGEPLRISAPFKKLVLAVVFLALSAFVVMIPVRKSVTAMFLEHDKACVLNADRK